MRLKIILFNLAPMFLNIFFCLLWHLEYSAGGLFGGGVTSFIQLIFNAFLIPIYLVVINLFNKKIWENNLIVFFALLISYFLGILINFINTYISFGLDSIGWAIEKLQFIIGFGILAVGWIFICFIKIKR